MLASISGHDDVAALDPDELLTLARELRTCLIETVTATGGHLGPCLGTVELTIALHRVFDSPHDVLIFDTGHQAYSHKLLTGRAADFHTLRKWGGLSGYPSRPESSHDWVENSHASVSLAWADGMAKAMHMRGETGRRVVAVIGDGAVTGGVAWEGLNNLGASSLPVIVVLNDNDRSYDPTVGALAAHLGQLRRRESEVGNLFTTLGFAYLGPVDGHDVMATSAMLRRAATITGPVVVHAVTAKGRGYPPAEANADDRMHACGVVDPRTGQSTMSSGGRSWTDVFENEIAELARTRQDVVALTAAMRLPTGLGALSRSNPHRVFDSGIAEQHLLASAAGMATAGAHPVVALYSTFLHRALDQLLLDIGLHHLPVTVVLDRAGITGPDGPSHHGIWDLALLSCVPGIRVACPRDAARLRELLHEAIDVNGPTALRYPKGTAGQDIPAVAQLAGMDILYDSPQPTCDVLLVSVGAMAGSCLEAAAELTDSGIGVTVVDPRWVWPLNPALAAVAARHRITVSVEDGIADGGIGTRLVQMLSEQSPTYIRALGLPTAYIPHGSRSELLAHFGLTGSDIATACRSLLRTAPEHSAA
ncbi:1-deoxy-D-xylulose-5-phosphate synthase [Mycolicibacterium sp. XJ870]